MDAKSEIQSQQLASLLFERRMQQQKAQCKNVVEPAKLTPGKTKALPIWHEVGEQAMNFAGIMRELEGLC